MKSRFDERLEHMDEMLRELGAYRKILNDYVTYFEEHKRLGDIQHQSAVYELAQYKARDEVYQDAWDYWKRVRKSTESNLRVLLGENADETLYALEIGCKPQSLRDLVDVMSKQTVRYIKEKLNVRKQ